MDFIITFAAQFVILYVFLGIVFIAVWNIIDYFRESKNKTTLTVSITLFAVTALIMWGIKT